QQHRWWTGNNDFPHLLAELQFAGDQTRLDRFAQANVMSDEQVDPRQQQRFAQRFELISVQPDAGAKWRLEQLRVSGRDAVPLQRVEVGGKHPRIVKTLRSDPFPGFPSENFGVEFLFPEDFEWLPLVVVINA